MACTDMLLIYPPVAKPSEPPVGLATLAGVLKKAGAPVRILDASAEAICFLINRVEAATDTWTRRALTHRDDHLQSLSRWPVYANQDRYRRAVLDLNRLVEAACKPAGVKVSLSDYHDPDLSPVQSVDLLRAAREWRENVFSDYFRERVRPLVEEVAPDWVGISLNYLSQAPAAFALMGFLKESFPGIRLVLGGGLVTSWMSRPDWYNPFDGLADRIWAGPGEELILELCGKEPMGDAAAVPEYAQLLPGPYLAPGPIIAYAASRGCYWGRCAFCPEKAEGHLYRPLAPDRVVADLRVLTQDLRPALVHLVDNALSPALLETLARNPPGLPWYGFARVSPRLTDPDFCRALKAAGCVMIKLGLESGDDTVLEGMGKGIDTKTAAKALWALHGAGIATYVYLLFGTPWENEAAAEKTLTFAATNAGAVDYLNLAVFNLPAHSPEAAGLETRPFYSGDLNLYWDFVHPSGWSRSRVRRFLEKRLKRHLAIAPILRRQPPFFTSNHAPLAVLAKMFGSTAM